jgi:hypothetical protein
LCERGSSSFILDGNSALELVTPAAFLEIAVLGLAPLTIPVELFDFFPVLVIVSIAAAPSPEFVERMELCDR